MSVKILKKKKNDIKLLSKAGKIKKAINKAK
jgi:hypothetical protein